MALICRNGCRECSGCGNCFPEANIAGRCKDCGDPIYQGDHCLVLDDAYYCEFCLHEMSLDEILALTGLSLEAAV